MKAKKLLAVLLAAVMVFSVSVVAFADEPKPENPATAPAPAGENPVEPLDGMPQITVKQDKKTIIATSVAIEKVQGMIEDASNADEGYSCEVDLKGATLFLDTYIDLDDGDFELTIKHGTIDGQDKTLLFYVCDANTTINLEDVTLVNGNSVVSGDNYGGAFEIDDDNVIIRGKKCVISNCKAKYGGAIYLTSYADDSEISGITFGYNQATEDAGAVYINGADVTITDCKFMYNSTRDGGGSIYVNDDEAIITKCQFEGGQTVTGYGKEIYLNDKAIIEQCEFLDSVERDAIKFKSNKYYTSLSNTFAGGNAATASLVSGGSVWIIVAVVVVAAAVCIILVNKNKKGATK